MYQTTASTFKVFNKDCQYQCYLVKRLSLSSVFESQLILVFSLLTAVDHSCCIMIGRRVWSWSSMNSRLACVTLCVCALPSVINVSQPFNDLFEDILCGHCRGRDCRGGQNCMRNALEKHAKMCFILPLQKNCVQRAMYSSTHFFNAVAIFSLFFMAQDAILEKKGRGMELNCLANSS